MHIDKIAYISYYDIIEIIWGKIMTENAKIARLWQGFHHLSENNKDLVLTFAEAVGCLEKDPQTVPEQTGVTCDVVLAGEERK